ncbi:hypothetical protein RHSIM_Rhsim05G0081900 [Rhododendron simsii]|uniref:Uncharacterized protein n=1 Tax=Rhododendron simsii TaxID=118357 RepID=A0A834H031_RHOSS|nr:hypothetical protein RHSIM_Rhsim05G0081900 [Rhododendron simsii]
MSSTTAATTHRLLRFLLVATLVLSSCSVPSTAKVKGCRFTTIYTFGDRNDSTSDGSTMSDPLCFLFPRFHLPSPKPYTTESPGAEFLNGASFATVMRAAFFVERDIPFPIHPLKQSLDAQIESFFKNL